MTRLRQLLRAEILARVAVDVLLVNAALILALAVRFVQLVFLERASQTVIAENVEAYSRALSISWLPLTAISIATFAACGFYTRSLFYRGRYKAIAVVQGTAIAYLLFGFFSYFLFSKLTIPRGALVFGWAGTTALILMVRVSSWIWAKLHRSERRRITVESRPIEDVLVIGGAGYVGSALLPKLLTSGYRVRLLDVLMYGTEPVAPYLSHPRLELIQSDFRQVDTVVRAVREADAVIHLGGLVGDPACALDEDLTIDINLSATRTIAEVAKGSGVQRFVFASTCSVYGASDELLDERSILSPVSLYARSKIASEKVLLALADHAFAPTILRFGTIYGLSGRTRFDLVVNLLTAKALFEGQITVFGGDQWRPFLHVDDAAAAILKTLQAPLQLVRNETFNVGSDAQNATLGDIGGLIHTLVPEAQLLDMGADGDRRNYRVSFAKIRRALQFQPQWTLEQGVRQVIDAIRSGKVTDYREVQYSNVKFLHERAGTESMRRQTNWERVLIDDSGPVFAPPAGPKLPIARDH